MNRKAIHGTLFAALLLAGFLGVWRLQLAMDGQHSAERMEEQELTLRSPAVLKKLSLEYAPLMGAIYWTRAVQYYGEKHRLHDPHLELLWPLLDITTTLDPQLIVAYRFGAVFLSDSPPRGAGQPDRAVELLERGMKANPQYWRFYQDLGNVYYFDKRDYLNATRAFEAGGRFPGAPPFLKIMAARIAAQGESLETSYALWLDIYQSTTNSEIRKNAEDHLRLVKAEMDLRELNRLADEFETKLRRRPLRIGDLIETGLLPGQPRDPEGFPYVLGEGGRAEIDPKSPLHEDWLRDQFFAKQANSVR
jgi:tetratricopeptide (TPR) repeat protein